MSVPESELSNFQNLYQKHVHDNLMLYDHVRQLDAEKRNILKQLEHSKDAFLNKYAKHSNRRRTYSEPQSKGSAPRDGTKARTPRPRFLICKNLPYSLKSWSDLVDVSKECGLDIYKTEVLQSKVGERSDEDENQSVKCAVSERKAYSPAKTAERASAAYSTPEKRRRSVSDPTKMLTASPEKSPLGCHLKVDNVKQISKTCAEDRMSPRMSPKVSPRLLRRGCQTQTKLNVKQNQQAKKGDCTSQVSERVDIRLSEIPKLEINNCEITADDATQDLCQNENRYTHRKRLSVAFPSVQEHFHRKRSNTIDNPTRPNILNLMRRSREVCLEPTKSLTTLNGLRRLNSLTQLLHSSCSELMNIEAELESDKLRRSFEDLQKCRYLRTPDTAACILEH